MIIQFSLLLLPIGKFRTVDRPYQPDEIQTWLTLINVRLPLMAPVGCARKTTLSKKSFEPPSYFLAKKLERQQKCYFCQEKFFSI